MVYVAEFIREGRAVGDEQATTNLGVFDEVGVALHRVRHGDRLHDETTDANLRVESKRGDTPYAIRHLLARPYGLSHRQDLWDVFRVVSVSVCHDATSKKPEPLVVADARKHLTKRDSCLYHQEFSSSLKDVAVTATR